MSASFTVSQLVYEISFATLAVSVYHIILRMGCDRHSSYLVHGRFSVLSQAPSKRSVLKQKTKALRFEAKNNC